MRTPGAAPAAVIAGSSFEAEPTASTRRRITDGGGQVGAASSPADVSSAASFGRGSGETRWAAGTQAFRAHGAPCRLARLRLHGLSPLGTFQHLRHIPPRHPAAAGWHPYHGRHRRTGLAVASLHCHRDTLPGLQAAVPERAHRPELSAIPSGTAHPAAPVHAADLPVQPAPAPSPKMTRTQRPLHALSPRKKRPAVRILVGSGFAAGFCRRRPRHRCAGRSGAGKTCRAGRRNTVDVWCSVAPPA